MRFMSAYSSPENSRCEKNTDGLLCAEEVIHGECYGALFYRPRYQSHGHEPGQSLEIYLEATAFGTGSRLHLQT
jgi:hypothetical protein